MQLRGSLERVAAGHMLRQLRNAIPVVLEWLRWLALPAYGHPWLTMALVVWLVGPFRALAVALRVAKYALDLAKVSRSPVDQPTVVDLSFTTATPSVSGLVPGVTACGMFLSSKVAAMASASAAVPRIASIAKAAFGDDVELEAVPVLPSDWKAMAVEISKQTDAIITNVHKALQSEQRELAYVREVAKHTARQIAGLLERDGGAGPQPPGILAAFWCSELARQKDDCQRTLGRLLDLAKRRRPIRASLREEVDALRKEMFAKLLSAPGEGKPPVNPGAFFKQGVNKLNGLFQPSSTEHPPEGIEKEAAGAGKPSEDSERAWKLRLAQSLLVSARPDEAAFLQDVRTSQGAGNMVHGAILNARNRLGKLDATLGSHQDWTNKTEHELHDTWDRVDKAVRWHELQRAANEIMRVVEEWLGMIQERYFA